MSNEETKEALLAMANKPTQRTRGTPSGETKKSIINGLADEIFAAMKSGYSIADIVEVLQQKGAVIITPKTLKQYLCEIRKSRGEVKSATPKEKTPKASAKGARKSAQEKQPDSPQNGSSGKHAAPSSSEEEKRGNQGTKDRAKNIAMSNDI